MDFKKYCLCGGAIALTAFGMLAVPAKKGFRTFTQPDGTVITLNLVGDEHFHSFVTKDGLAVDRGADGVFYYRGAEGLSSLRAADPEKRSSFEKGYLTTNGNRFQLSSLVESNGSSIKARRGSAPAKLQSQVPNNGSPRIPVVLVQYKDYKFKDSDPNAVFTSFFKSGDTSAYQYFVDQSNGKYTPQFDIYGPYTLASNRATYGGNDYSGNDKGVGRMVGEGCLLGDKEIDFSRYDNDGDGECDVVIFLYAGDGEASSYDEDCEDAVWPCQWELSNSDYGKSLTLDRTRVDKFAVFNELNGSNLREIDGIGTFCHEFSHCLGLPDFYDTQYGPHFGMAHWSLLDYGCYNDDGYTPVGYTAYEKEFMGWIEIEEAKENTLYNLPVFNQKNAATDKAVKLTNPNDKNEYYIIENRANQGWDTYMPAEGLLIYHVTFSQSAWDSNCVNDYDMQRMTPVPADNQLKLVKESSYDGTYYVVDEDNLKGDLWPYGNATELTDTSTPAATVNTGKLLGKPVTEITRNNDGSISFWAMKAPLPLVDTPAEITHMRHNESSATISWTPASQEVTYTLELRPHRDITYELVSSTTFNNEDHGWDSEGFAEIDSNEHYLRMGSNKQVGGVISPAFQGDGSGVVTVKVNAKSYGNDESGLVVSTLRRSGSKLVEIDSQTIDLTSRYADYTVVLEGAEGEMYVELATEGKKKRVFVSRADIYNGDASDSASMARAASDVITIPGILATSYKVEGLTENGVYDCRVKAVPVDPETYSASAWSEVYLLDLSEETSVMELEGASSEAVYYTLEGLRVEGRPTAPGIYIELRGSKARRVLVK